MKILIMAIMVIYANAISYIEVKEGKEIKNIIELSELPQKENYNNRQNPFREIYELNKEIKKLKNEKTEIKLKINEMVRKHNILEQEIIQLRNEILKKEDGEQNLKKQLDTISKIGTYAIIFIAIIILIALVKIKRNPKHELADT